MRNLNLQNFYCNSRYSTNQTKMYPLKELLTRNVCSGLDGNQNLNERFNTAFNFNTDDEKIDFIRDLFIDLKRVIFFDNS